MSSMMIFQVDLRTIPDTGKGGKGRHRFRFILSCSISVRKNTSAYLFWGINRGKMGTELTWLEPAVLLIFLKVLSNCFQWWRMGVPQTRTETDPNPQLWSTLSSAAPQSPGRAISRCGELLRLGSRNCPLPAAVSSYRPSAEAALLSAPSVGNSLHAWASSPAVVK